MQVSPKTSKAMSSNRLSTHKRKGWLLRSILAATIVNGLLAGGNVDRALIAVPAWRQAGLVGWANFSRSADLGNGRVVYPVMAIGGTLLSVVAAFLSLLEARNQASSEARKQALPVLLAAALMLLSLPLSFKAVPFMLSLRHLGNEDLAGLGRAFSGFEFWGRLQGLFHVAAFCVNLWSIVSCAKAQTFFGSVDSFGHINAIADRLETRI